MNSIPPAFILLAGAGLVFLLPQRIRPWIAVAASGITIAYLAWILDKNSSLQLSWLGFEMVPVRIDKLSLIFGYVFALAALIGQIYAFHIRKRDEQVATLLYSASALGVVFAGDLITVVVFWEIMAITSAYIVLVGGREKSHGAGIRYLFVHLVGGTVLLGGIIWHISETGIILFSAFDVSIATCMILFGFAVNAAIPPLHAWLSDAYPEASVSGAVFLSAFTTKTAVYVLARGFPGWDILIIAGVVMALYGMVLAVLENDIRRLLAYHIISQVGYMVAAVGIGSESAINGASAHAFAHVIYKGLLLMGAGTVLYATGKTKMTDLGGIAGRMPVAVTLYMIGALSISAFPLFSGFVSKSLVINAAEMDHISWVVFLLYAVSTGTFLHTGLKLPYFTWFGPKQNIEIKSLPLGMYLGMGIAAALCIAIGVYPAPFYDLLPYANDYVPYTASHVISSLLLLGSTGLGFWLLINYFGPHNHLLLDTDWVYRKARKPVEGFFVDPVIRFFAAVQIASNKVTAYASNYASPPNKEGQTNPVATIGIGIIVVLLIATSVVLFNLLT